MTTSTTLAPVRKPQRTLPRNLCVIASGTGDVAASGKMVSSGHDTVYGYTGASIHKMLRGSGILRCQTHQSVSCSNTHYEGIFRS